MNKIQNMIINPRKTIEEKRSIYGELMYLRELIINTSLINLDIEKLEILDIIRFETLENLCFMEIALLEYSGISIEGSLVKLERLYNNNSEGGINHRH